MARLAYGPYEPDKPEAVFQAKNVWPIPDGYRPVLSHSPITPQLAGFLGGAAFVASDGTASLLGGTGGALYRFASGAWNNLTSTTASFWRFDQFGDRVIAVNGGAPIAYDLVGGTAGALAGSPPVSSMVATVRQQVFLAGDPGQNNVVFISGYNDSEEWTPGTNQSLSVPFPNGGKINGLAGGETGLILQERSIKRATYTGDVTVWQFDEISRDIGCMAQGSVAQAGYLVFFLSEQGFKVTDRNTVTPIGSEKIDRTFFSTYSRSDIVNKIQAAVDPRSTTVIWSMPGNPGMLWCYNWTLDRWTTIETPVLGVFSGFTANVTLEGVDVLYPGGIDSVPYSLDDPIFAGGNPLFMVANWEGLVGPLAGPTLEASFGIRPIELVEGARARIRGARAVSDAVVGTVNVDARARAGDPAGVVTSGAIRNNGRVPLRANGRHVGFEHVIPAGAVWSYARGLDVEFQAAGWN